MLDFLFEVLKLCALVMCLMALRAASLDQFIIHRIFKTRGRDYFRNNQRRNKLENYIYLGFKNVIPMWLYLFNLCFTAIGCAVVLFMFIGFAFGAAWLIKFALWLFMYLAIISLIANLLYNLVPKKLVRKWNSVGLYSCALVTLPITAIVWSICF
ncbi:MAG: hypothetical protein E7588_10240 [Ruminococcaceae bacterium]|nr:hypothetical protein [Oscillospiraceae bacterium]